MLLDLRSLEEAASGTTIIETEGLSIGLSVATGNAAAIWNSLGSSDGLAGGTGVSAAIWAGVGSSDGLAVGTGLSAAIWDSLGSSDGISTVTGLGAALWDVLASSGGVATVLGESETVVGFPTQYDGVRVFGSTIILCLVAEADAPAAMGGVVKVEKNSTNYALYIVETTDPHASAVRLKTTTGIKSIRLKT